MQSLLYNTIVVTEYIGELIAKRIKTMKISREQRNLEHMPLLVARAVPIFCHIYTYIYMHESQRQLYNSSRDMHLRQTDHLRYDI